MLELDDHVDYAVETIVSLAGANQSDNRPDTEPGSRGHKARHCHHDCERQRRQISAAECANAEGNYSHRCDRWGETGCDDGTDAESTPAADDSGGGRCENERPDHGQLADGDGWWEPETDDTRRKKQPCGRKERYGCEPGDVPQIVSVYEGSDRTHGALLSVE